MIVLKYEKAARAKFISHIDLLKHTARTIRRAGIPVKFSNGYSPHALVFFSAPLALGVGSVAEYLVLDTDMDASQVIERYNAACPEGLKANRVFKCEKNPNLQGKIVCADYVFPTDYRPLDLSNGFEIEYVKKGEPIKEEVASKIFALLDENGRLCMRLATGNITLRPDRLVPTLNKMLGVDMSAADIVKVRQYFSGEGGLVDADEYLVSLAPKN